MIPSTLFAGVFFPVDQLPARVRPLAYASPLWHGVELCRAATLGVRSARGRSWLHVAYLRRSPWRGCAWAGRGLRASDFRTED